MGETEEHRRKQNDMLYQFLRDMREDLKEVNCTVGKLSVTQGAHASDIARLQERVKSMQAHIEEMDEHGTRSKSDEQNAVNRTGTMKTEDKGAWVAFFSSPIALAVVVALMFIIMAIIAGVGIYVAVTGQPASNLNPIGG